VKGSAGREAAFPFLPSLFASYSGKNLTMLTFRFMQVLAGKGRALLESAKAVHGPYRRSKNVVPVAAKAGDLRKE
jgi:hypothetical protein